MCLSINPIIYMDIYLIFRYVASLKVTLSLTDSLTNVTLRM